MIDGNLTFVDNQAPLYVGGDGMTVHDLIYELNNQQSPNLSYLTVTGQEAANGTSFTAGS